MSIRYYFFAFKWLEILPYLGWGVSLNLLTLPPSEAYYTYTFPKKRKQRPLSPQVDFVDKHQIRHKKNLNVCVSWGGWQSLLSSSNRELNFFKVCVVSEGWLNFSRPNFSNSVSFQAVALALDISQGYSMRAFGGWLGWLAFSRNSRKKNFECVRRFGELTSLLEAKFFKQCPLSSNGYSSRDSPGI